MAWHNKLIYLELVENISIGPSKEYLQSQSQGSDFQFVNLSHKLQSSLEWRELLHGLTAGVFWPWVSVVARVMLYRIVIWVGFQFNTIWIALRFFTSLKEQLLWSLRSNWPGIGWAAFLPSVSPSSDLFRCLLWQPCPFRCPQVGSLSCPQGHHSYSVLCGCCLMPLP